MSGLQFPKRTQQHIFTLPPLLSFLNTSAMSLPRETYPSTLSYTLLFLLITLRLPYPFTFSLNPSFFTQSNSFHMMAPPARTYPLRGFQVAITLAFFFSLILLLPISAIDSSERLNLDERKVVIGSKPPACGNKCMKCRPCIATVVVPNHKTKCFKAVSDDSYYLLSWKCRCGNKFFQP